MALEDMPPTIQDEVLRLVDHMQGFSLVETTMRLRALQELSDLLGSDALMKLVAALTSGL